MATGDEGETYSIPLTLKIRAERESLPQINPAVPLQEMLQAQLPLPPFEQQSKTMQVAISGNLHEYLRIHAALTRQSLREVTEKAVKSYINKLEEDRKIIPNT